MNWKRIFIQSIQDDRQAVDGKLLTMFFSFAMMLFAACVNLLTAWYYKGERTVTLDPRMWDAFLFITLFGIGASAASFYAQTRVDKTKLETRAKTEQAHINSDDENCDDAFEEEPKPIDPKKMYGDLSRGKITAKEEYEKYL